MAVSLLSASALASGASPESTSRADKLYSLHLFRGTADGYQLHRAPTRMQGLVMLIRLLGQEEAALACTDPVPFRDLTWGETYAAYAYARGITRGTGPDTFNPGGKLSARNYVAFLLRALGYEDEVDFTYGETLTFAAGISLMTAEAAGKLEKLALNRGDMVDFGFAALTCRMKGGGRTLAEKLRDDGVFTTAEGRAAGVLGGSGWIYQYVPYDDSTITYAKKTLAGVTAHVLTVNTANPRVTVKSALVDDTLGHTAAFSKIVKDSGAAAAINGNFFAAYSSFKTPIGHVMVDGEFLYGNSGVTSLGITADGELRIGRPALFIRIKPASGAAWAAYELNTSSQTATGCTLYTPAYGKSVAIKTDGSLLTVRDGAIAEFRAVSTGTSVSIPAGGFVAFMGPKYTATNYFRTPTVGTAVTLEYYLHHEDAEGFTLDGVESVISGAPRLVQDGEIVTTLEAGFTEARFTTSSTPQTAVGVNAEGKLLLVSVPKATIQQMRELMLALGCVDAFNVDGGASCGMYYNGKYLATPGRELTVTLQVFVDP